MQTPLLIIIAILLTISVIYIQYLKHKMIKAYGRTKDIERVTQELERTRLQELHNQIEAKREELMKTMDEESHEMYKKLEAKKAELEKEYYDKKYEIDKYVDKAIAESQQEVLEKKEIFNKELCKIMEDKAYIEQTLEELKNRQRNTVEALKEQQKEKSEVDFHRIVFTKENIEDISQLKSVEQYIHNKDVLRKLIYKTYVESSMNEMFNRVGITEAPGIYKIENTLDGKVYIGQSVNVRNRLRDHIKSAVGISTIASQIVHDIMKEEGLENFIFHLVDECDRAGLNEREKYWIDFYKSNDWGYNRTKGGS